MQMSIHFVNNLIKVSKLNLSNGSLYFNLSVIKKKMYILTRYFEMYNTNRTLDYFIFYDNNLTYINILTN